MQFLTPPTATPPAPAPAQVARPVRVTSTPVAAVPRPKDPPRMAPAVVAARRARDEPRPLRSPVAPSCEPPSHGGVADHIYYASSGKGFSRAKTVCTSAVLAAFGIAPGTYKYSGMLKQRLAILNRNGFAARSRKSRLPKGISVGAARKIIANNNWGDPRGTRYMIRVQGHALLLDNLGATIVDTAPRKRDRRTILDIRAVFRA